jgi:eukaryotic-like serine/threonine-protein kinase
VPVSPGARLGPYDIICLLGEGGMGEVYRARDTRLGRDVAIKSLPASVAADPERVTRFEREAQILAALNHPHIATIHGIVEAHGVTCIVLELVEGESLAARIEAGPVPVAQALAIAREIAGALQAAHLKGIVHRDLKPANVMLTPEGHVKVLDFGLAKAFDPALDAAARDVANSPTFTSPATQVGVILGTAAYMAPEQAKGKAVDKRADIWAFGCVCYEMLTGRRPFGGDDATEAIIAIMRDEPDWTRLPPGLPPVFERYLRRCLEKNPAERVQDIGDMRLALDGAFDVAASPDQPAPPARASTWRMVAAATLLATAAAAAAWTLKPAPRPPAPPVRRFTFTPSPALAIANTNRDVTITPDGSTIVYIAVQGGIRKAFVRRLDALAATMLHEGGSLYEPLTSPDSRWVAFVDERDFTLRKMSLSGGPMTTIARIGHETMGATWGSDDTIVYATTDGLWRVPASGGVPVLVAKPDASRGETQYAWPELLPGGRTMLLSIRSGALAGDVAVAAMDLQSHATKVLVQGGTGPHYSPTGHLLYVAEGALRAVAFDPASLEVRGTSVSLVEGVVSKTLGGADFALAADGTLVYLAGAGNIQRRLVWIDRDGTRQPLAVPERAYVIARLSPDATRIALDVRGQQPDIWIWDIARETLSRLTDSPAFDGQPVWTRDSRQVIFTSMRDGPPGIFIQPADGSSPARRLIQTTTFPNPTSITPDGLRLLYRADPPSRQNANIMVLPIDGSAPPSTVLATDAGALNGEVSPDGHFIAYESNEGAGTEVYVRPFPDVSAGRWQISSGGGMHPAWAAGGRELYFLAADSRLFRVDITLGPAFRAGTPKLAIPMPIYDPAPLRAYDVTPDGTRLLIIEDATTGPQQAPAVTVVLGWSEELKRLIPNSPASVVRR